MQLHETAKERRSSIIFAENPHPSENCPKAVNMLLRKENTKSHVRCKVEHVFAIVKKLFGYRKTRYRGLRKQTAKNFIMFALANLYLADRKSLSF